MSADTDGDRIADSDAIVESLHRWYHVPALAAVIAFVVWTRTRAYDRFVRDGAVYFSGNDAYYHYRATMYSVENWPRRLNGEPWTQFPYGTNVGQFGTLMDQVVATVALIVGLGDPSSRQVAIVAVLTPVVLAALISIPIYYLTKRLSGSRIGGVVAAVVLALVPQASWVSRTTVGFYDHHVAEALMMAIAVLATVHALVVVRRERPVFEQVQDQDWDGLWPSVRASALAGLALGLYLHTWPSGVVLAGIFGVFFVVTMVQAVLQGRSPEHVGFVAVISMAVAAVLILPWSLTLAAETVELSFLQLAGLLGVGAGGALLAWLAREWEDRQFAPESYPLAVFALAAVAVGVVYFALPDLYNSIWSNMQRILFLGQSDATLTISEAQSMFGDDRPPIGDQFWQGYGFTAFTALGALLWMTARAVLAKRPREEYMLIAIWTVFLLLMAMTQVRFHYYLVLAVAVLNGWLVVQVARLVSFPTLADVEDIQTYHVLTVFAVIMLLVVPIAGPLAVATSAGNAEEARPGEVTTWDGNLDWMSENTPTPGEYSGADNAMDYYGPFDDFDGDYEYPEGAYGVMSWWDYGHWITVEGERIPNANPFQQGPRAASAFFQNTSEERANMYLDALPADDVSGGQLDGMTEAELQAAIDSRTEQQAGEETRYVMIDDQMTSTKFFAMTEWAGAEYGEYFGSQQYQIGDQNTSLPVTNERFHESMLGRLYDRDAATLEHYRLVKESSTYSMLGGSVSQGGGVQPRTLLSRFDGWDQARNVSAQLQQARLFGQALQFGDGYAYDASVQSAVKTFERVDGATITGEAEPNSSVQAFVELQTGPGRTFTYAQTGTADEDGQFELTVPYATTNELGPEDGYTNSSVEATGGYTVRSTDGQSVTANASDVAVPEPAIYEGSEIEVDLAPVETGTGNESSNDTASSAAQSTSATDASGSAPGAFTSGADAVSVPSALEPGTATAAAPLGAPIEAAIDALAARIAG